MSKAKKGFLGEVLAGIREVFNPRFLAVCAAIVLGVGALAWFSANTDPRYHAFCGKPTDVQIILYFLALPILLGTSIVGLGEATLWSRERAGRPRQARAHGLRALLLLGTAVIVALAAGLGFASLCPY